MSLSIDLRSTLLIVTIFFIGLLPITFPHFTSPLLLHCPCTTFCKPWPTLEKLYFTKKNFKILIIKLKLRLKLNKNYEALRITIPQTLILHHAISDLQPLEVLILQPKASGPKIFKSQKTHQTCIACKLFIYPVLTVHTMQISPREGTKKKKRKKGFKVCR